MPDSSTLPGPGRSGSRVPAKRRAGEAGPGAGPRGAVPVRDRESRLAGRHSLAGHRGDRVRRSVPRDRRRLLPHPIANGGG